MKDNLQFYPVDKLDICVIFWKIFKEKSTKSTKLSTFTPLSFYHKSSVSSTIFILSSHISLTGVTVFSIHNSLHSEISALQP